MPKKQPNIDAEMQQFMNDLLESVRQMKAGRAAANQAERHAPCYVSPLNHPRPSARSHNQTHQ